MVRLRHFGVLALSGYKVYAPLMLRTFYSTSCFVPLFFLCIAVLHVTCFHHCSLPLE